MTLTSAWRIHWRGVRWCWRQPEQKGGDGPVDGAGLLGSATLVSAPRKQVTTSAWQAVRFAYRGCAVRGMLNDAASTSAVTPRLAKGQR